MTLREVFADATAWIAIADAGDAHHTDAVRIYTDLLRRRIRLVTIDLMVAEAQIWIRRRMSHHAAMTFLERVNESVLIELVYINAQLEAETKAILRQYDDQDFSFADAAAFALMRQRGITHAFTFIGTLSLLNLSRWFESERTIDRRVRKTKKGDPIPFRTNASRWSATQPDTE